MILQDLAASAVTRALGGPGLVLRVGPFAVRVSSALSTVADHLRSHYADFPLQHDAPAHFSVSVDAAPGLRRWARPQVVFRADDHAPFYPLPLRMAPALFEWGLNWCIARRVHHLLVIHCAVVSRHGHAILLPASPEAGKSTLCAALVTHGWQFGSDEFALIDPSTGAVHPLPRPISLKNHASDVIAARWTDAHFGPEVFDAQGTRIRYLRPPAASVREAVEAVRARWIAIPRYRAGSPTILEAESRARMLPHLADSSYNFSQFGKPGFDRLAAIVEEAPGFTLTYSNIDEALSIFDRLERESRSEAPQSHATSAA